MYGAIVGDIIGSRWEFERHKSRQFPLFSEYNGITDDSILTTAVADALLHDLDPAERLRFWGRAVMPGRHVGGYGQRFIKWLATPTVQPPYNSWGNGGAMRVSPAAWLGRDMIECLAMADRVTAVTHNHPEGMKGARATTYAIRLALEGKSPQRIRSLISDQYGYDLSRSVDVIRTEHEYNESAAGCVPEALTCALEACDFEDAIRNAVSLGGDADTLAAIAGGVAEAMFGIPENLGAQAWHYLPDSMREVTTAFYASVPYSARIRDRKQGYTQV